MSGPKKRIKFARIIFLDSKNKQHIYSTDDIKYNKTDSSPINPNDETDFEKNHKYYIKYYLCSDNGEACNNQHEHDYSYYGAIIYSLGATIDDVTKELQNAPRIQYPNSKYLGTSDSDDLNLQLSQSKSSQLKKKLADEKKAATLKQRSEKVLSKLDQSFNVPQFVDESERTNEDTNSQSTCKELQICLSRLPSESLSKIYTAKTRNISESKIADGTKSQADCTLELQTRSDSSMRRHQYESASGSQPSPGSKLASRTRPFQSSHRRKSSSREHQSLTRSGSESLPHNHRSHSGPDLQSVSRKYHSQLTHTRKSSSRELQSQTPSGSESPPCKHRPQSDLRSQLVLRKRKCQSLHGCEVQSASRTRPFQSSHRRKSSSPKRQSQPHYRSKSQSVQDSDSDSNNVDNLLRSHCKMTKNPKSHNNQQLQKNYQAKLQCERRSFLPDDDRVGSQPQHRSSLENNRSKSRSRSGSESPLQGDDRAGSKPQRRSSQDNNRAESRSRSRSRSISRSRSRSRSWSRSRSGSRSRSRSRSVPRDHQPIPNKRFTKTLPQFVIDSINYYKEGNPGAADGTRRYEVSEDNKRYLGEGFSMPNVNWEMIKVRKRPELFLIELAMNIWKPANLCNRALHLSRCVNNIPYRSPIKLIEKEKLRLLISYEHDCNGFNLKVCLNQLKLDGLYADYLDNLSLKAAKKVQYLLDVTSVLRNKIYKLRMDAIRAAGGRPADPRRRLRYNAIE